MINAWKKNMLVKLIVEVEQSLSKKVCRRNQNNEYFEYLVTKNNISFEDASWMRKSWNTFINIPIKSPNTSLDLFSHGNYLSIEIYLINKINLELTKNIYWYFNIYKYM